MHSPSYCPRCNYNDHRCPGCGDYLNHGVHVCKQCKIDYMSDPVYEVE